MKKDISEHAVTIRGSAIQAWEAYRNGDKAKAYKLYTAIQIAAREAADQCAEGYPELPKGWPYKAPGFLDPDKASCVASAYERVAINQGRNSNPVYPENKVCLSCGEPCCGCGE